MSGDSDHEDRTEQPTAKRLEDARNKGQIPRSRELTTMLVTLTGAVTLIASGGTLGEGFLTLLRHQLSPAVLADSDPSQLPSIFLNCLVDGLMLVMPFLLLSVAAVLLSSWMLGGWTFRLSLKPEALNPIAGLQRLVSAKSAMELLKSIIKVIFVGAVAWLLLVQTSDELLSLGRQTPETAIRHSGGLLLHFFLIVSLPLVVIAMIDAPWQWWSHRRELRMTRQEIIDEHKESDGRPEVKSRIREMQMAASRRRMMEQVPKADVIITNPTHFAVALKYDELRNGAPVLLAKGADEVAARIRELGGANDIPLVSCPRLARAVFASTELDQEIPAGLYLAVAQILTYVYQLRQWQDLGGDAPVMPEPEIEDIYLKGLA